MNYEILGYTFAAIVAIAGGIGTLYKVISAMRKEREEENKKILVASETYTDTKIKTVEIELSHQKEIHEGKTAELSVKIEELKEEMRRHHFSLVELLTKLVSKD